LLGIFVKITSTSAPREDFHILQKRFEFEDLSPWEGHGIKFALL
jgi:hypothetical protein